MRVRLLTTLKAGEKMIAAGVYDTESEGFPEELNGESRLHVIEFLDGNKGWETTPVQEDEEGESEGTDEEEGGESENSDEEEGESENSDEEEESGEERPVKMKRRRK